MADLDLDKLEGLLKAADEERNGPRSESIFPARLEYATALHNAAPELIAAARKLEALEITLDWLRVAYGSVGASAAEFIRVRADQIEKERSK